MTQSKAELFLHCFIDWSRAAIVGVGFPERWICRVFGDLSTLHVNSGKFICSNWKCGNVEQEYKATSIIPGESLLHPGVFYSFLPFARVLRNRIQGLAKELQVSPCDFHLMKKVHNLCCRPDHLQIYWPNDSLKNSIRSLLSLIGIIQKRIPES